MKTTILAENQFGHGGRGSKIRRVIKRITRSKLGKASIPFDWSQPLHIQDKVGHIPRKNQGQSFSCGGQAGAYFIGSVLASLNKVPYVEQSAKSLYSPIFYPGGGTSTGKIEMRISKFGSVDEAIVTSYQQDNPPTELFMNDNSWINPTTTLNALPKGNWIPVSVNIDIESFAEAIRDHGAVIMEITGQNNGTWLSSLPQPPQTKANLWNHFMCSEGAEMVDGVKRIPFFQSWGDNVGNGGIQYFTENYFNSGYIIDAFTFIRITSKPNFSFTKDISYGDIGDEVRQLQIKLGLTPTGIFDFKTLVWLVTFKIKNGIRPITISVDEGTRLILNKK